MINNILVFNNTEVKSGGIYQTEVKSDKNTEVNSGEFLNVGEFKEQISSFKEQVAGIWGITIQK